ncbi:transferase [Lithospermum erythrorhizon]|uniref:Dol-P-Glc:Glc(2)Man(9)GlcNAc(2)-PP-Dol alpha-1,2-glucosyltransferase n=1 Tax=Lithospermum erythrorhizon TaxID=34254 RepID=A0AAV3NQA4_LITER
MGRKTVALIVSSWVIPISIIVNQIVPDPYMDEIFHIPQAQKYCKGDFSSWDPMITTPPGLYILSLANVACLFPGIFSLLGVTSFSEACSTSVLRATNGVLAVICSVLIYELIILLRPSLHERKATLYAVVLSLYPLHWFFSFLYYTDIASLTAVLAAYLFGLKKNYNLSALFGALAVLMRQTNIIWMGFIACTYVIDLTLSRPKEFNRLDISDISVRSDAGLISKNGSATASKLRKRKVTGPVDIPNYSRMQKTLSSAIPSSGLVYEIKEIMLSSWRQKWDMLASFSPYLLLLVAFVVFVYFNGSIVLGAKEAHTVSPHFAQLLYFGVVCVLFMAPMHFHPAQVAGMVRLFWDNKLRSVIQWFAALTAGLLSVHFFSIAHPYLLADNRHYPFYLWRKVISLHWSSKYLLVPVYVYSWFSIASLLGRNRTKSWILVFCFATAATLVPAPLIEFRYYTVPFFFVILHSHVHDDRSWLLMAMLYIIINVFTLFMFLYRPFSWKHEPGVQRFIW